MGHTDDEQQTAAEARLERMRDALENGTVPNLHDRERETLLEFDDAMRSINAAENRFGAHYQSELLWYMQQFAAEVGCLTETLENNEVGKGAVDDILCWFEAQDLADTSKASGLSALRVFADVMLECTSPGDFDDEELPDRFERITPKSHITDKDPSPLPSNVINWDDAVKMAETRTHIRDKALILAQLGSGLRPMAEQHKLQFKHLEDKGDHFVISTPAGAKTGRREVRLFAGSAILRKWINEAHPAHLETEPGPGPETYVWTHQNKNKPIVYGTMASVFRRAGSKAEIEKTHSPQHFRRSAASFAASKPTIGERELREQFGWSPFSTAPEHYITAFSTRVSIHFAEAYGHEIEDLDGEKLAPIECASCEEWTTRHFDSCIWCSHEIDEELRDIQHVVTDPDAPDKDLLEMLVDGDITADDLRSVQKLDGVIQTEPEFFDRLEKLIMLAEGYENEQETLAKAILGPLGLGAAYSQLATSWARAKDRILRASPEFEQYPPDRATAGKIVGSWAVLLMIALGLTFWNGSLGALVDGHAIQWAGLLTALGLGGIMIAWLLPDYEETFGVLLEEMQYGE